MCVLVVGSGGMVVPGMMGAALRSSAITQEERVKDISKEGPQGGSKYIREEILPFRYLNRASATEKELLWVYTRELHHRWYTHLWNCCCGEQVGQQLALAGSPLQPSGWMTAGLVRKRCWGSEHHRYYFSSYYLYRPSLFPLFAFPHFWVFFLLLTG